MNYGYPLKLVRQYSGKTQTELSSVLGYTSPCTVSQIEGSIRPPTLEMLTKYADWLDVSLSSLIGFIEVMDDQVAHSAMCPKMSRVLQWYKDTHV